MLYKIRMNVWLARIAFLHDGAVAASALAARGILGQGKARMQTNRWLFYAKVKNSSHLCINNDGFGRCCPGQGIDDGR